MRDDRPAGDETPPAVWYCYTPDRKGEHPKAHLSEFTGTLQADAYAGYERVYEDGRIQEAACWAHVRRKFYDLLVAHKSPVAAEAIEPHRGNFMPSKRKSGDDLRRNVVKFATRAVGRCWNR